MVDPSHKFLILYGSCKKHDAIGK